MEKTLLITDEHKIAGYRLSTQQQRTFDLSRGTESTEYGALVWLTALGRNISSESLDAAVRAAATRHEVLRTRFVSVSGLQYPVQSPQTEPAIRTEILDLADLSPRQQYLALKDIYNRKKQLFSLADSGQPELLIAQLGPGHCELMLRISALQVDETSLNLLIHDIGNAFDSYCEGSGVQEDDLLQYIDISEGLGDFLESPESRSGREFWAASNSHDLLPLRIPHDGATEIPASSLWMRVPYIPSDKFKRIRAIADQSGLQVSDFLLTCWRILLCTSAGKEGIAIGTFFDGRIGSESAGSVGPLANYLPLPFESSLDSTFLDALALTSSTVTSAREWESCFHWGLVEDKAETNRRSLYCAYQFGFHEQTAGYESFYLKLAMRRQHFYLEPFHLKLSATPRSGGLRLLLEYSPEAFNAGQVQKIIERWSTLLNYLTAFPESRIRELPLVGPAEAGHLISLGRGPQPSGQFAGFLELFERSAAAYPDSIAVISEGNHFRYCELNDRANRLAQILTQEGVRPESRVGIILGRSADFILAMLAVQKAGGCYVPLDGSQPPQRLAMMLEQVSATLVITDAQHCSALSGIASRTLLLEEQDLTPDGSQPQPRRSFHPENLAYIIFTSGSTGQPKGVAVEHRQLAAYIHAIQTQMKVFPGAQLALVSTLTADLGYTVLFSSLAFGGTLHILSEDQVRDGQLFADYFHKYAIDYLKIVPSHAETIFSITEIRNLLPRRLIVFGGEALSPSTIELLKAAGGSCALLNHYGPTETTVGVLTHHLSAEEITSAAMPLPVGRPLPGATAYILNEGLQLILEGVDGELFIGGANVARGYFGQASLTAERFVPDPFSGIVGGRLYRTGDRARFLPGGKIQFLGRRDNQVKVRGFRVELGEIEATLRTHHGVREAVVVAHQEPVAGHKLFAYVVLKRPRKSSTKGNSSGTEQQLAGAPEVPSMNELHEYLRRSLPDYMVPALLLELAALPLTPNGKLDRKALAALQPSPEQQHDFVAPRSPVEEVLVNIWAQVLQRERVGIHDNFFQLGGHSLLATQALWRIRSAFALDLSLRSLFDSPSPAALAPILEAALHNGSQQPLPPIPTADRGAELPLSFPQQRLWFLDQLHPASSAYNLPAAVRLRGTLLPNLLQASLQALVQRHEVLRTCFPTHDGRPRQHILPHLYVPLPRIDLSRLPLPQAELQARRWARQQAALPFLLHAPPLLRACLLSLAPDHHILLLTLHHIISDGWSTAILVREFSEFYQALLQHRSPSLPPLPVQYADFALWQRQWLQGQRLEQQLLYWRRQLAPPLPVLELPLDVAAPGASASSNSSSDSCSASSCSASSSQSRPAAAAYHLLPAPLARNLLALSRQQGATLFMTLLASFQLLLHRYSGQTDIVVGIPVAGRTRTEVQNLIGFFVNTLPIRSQLLPHLSFLHLLQQLRLSLLEAWAHQDIPLERIIEDLQPERHLDHQPLFQVSMSMQNAPTASPQLRGVNVESLPSASPEAKFDLSLSMAESSDGIHINVEYLATRFSPVTLQRLLTHWQQLLEGLAADPECCLANLPLLSSEERSQLLLQANPDPFRFSPHTVVELFEEQVALRPHALAVRDTAGNCLTYAQLNADANRWAHRLRHAGIGPEARVGVCLQRSCSLIVTLLAVLKSGAAYVPLDPSYPEERLAFMAQDANLALMLTQASLASTLPNTLSYSLPVLWIEDDESSESSNLPPMARPDNLAYIMYTSGSTGRPKGVMISHASIGNLVKDTNYVQISPGQAIAHLSNASFDASTFEIWGALLNGAETIIYDQDVMLSSSELRERLRKDRISAAFMTPRLFNRFIDQDPEIFSTLSYLFLGGEAPDAGRVYQAAHNSPELKLGNIYGPTETTTFACCHFISRDRPNGTVPMGTPISRTCMYVLDGQMQLVPPGTLGQLYIGGPGVARGYCNYPQLTAEKFVPDPFSSEPGRRLYQTGDIVRIASSNDLVFCGRTDNQVKIRGFRIELGEIESVLNQHPQVQTSAAVAHVFPDNEREVVAYFVPKEQPGPTPRQLHNFVTERLPRYMVPAAFVPLDALPLNNNGKLDYKALPDPNLASEQDTSKNSRPRTLEELRLCEIWEEVLGVAIRDVTTSFFEVGGNSLLMVALGARIEQVFGTCLSVATLYESDTITSQAAQLRENGVRPPFSCLVPIQPLGNKRLLYLIHPGGGMVHCYFELGREFRPDQPLMALQSLGLDAASEPHTTIEAMSQHYVDLIIAAQPEGPYRLGGWSLGGVVAFEMAREFVRRGHIVDRLFLLDTSCPGAFGPMSAYDVSDTELLLGIVGLPEGCGIAPDEFSRLTLDAQLTLLLNHAQETRSGMSSLELADARRLFEVLRRNTLAVREYVAGPYEGEITLYRAAEETNPLLEPALGWDRWAQVEMVTVPGTHQKMLDANIVSILASSMKTRLSH